MKISRKKPPFQPITITIENEDEAERFISIIDKADRVYRSASHPARLSAEEYELIIKISDAFTDMVGYR